MRKISLAALLLGLSGASVLPAQASSLPKADQYTHSVSLGTAPSIALNFAISPELAAGGSLAMPVYLGDLYLRYDLHGSYMLLQQGELTVRGVAGVFGDLNVFNQTANLRAPFGIEAGLALSYRFFSWFTGRINIATGIGLPQSAGLGLLPPIGGIELAFQPYEHFEASVGFNGNGDILALRYLF